MSIKVMVDSASDIRPEEAKEMGVIVLPITITIEDKEYADGVDITPFEFYEKQKNCKTLPKTSQINTYTFEEEMAKYVSENDELIVITISSKLSGTYNNALQASKKFNGKVRVIDSLNATIGEKILCKLALRLIEEKKSLNEIVDELELAKKNIVVMGIVDTLEYLKKGGRISATVAIAGTLLSIKPILQIIDGEIKMFSKAIGLKKANSVMNNQVKTNFKIDYNLPCELFWSGFNDEYLQKYAKDENMPFYNKQNVGITALGATIGTHVGPNAVGLAFFRK